MLTGIRVSLILVICFFLKNPEIIINDYNTGIINEEKILRYLLILAIYNRSDLVSLIKNNISNKFTKKNQIRNLEILIDKKVKKINFFRKYSIFFDNFLNNYI